MKIKSFNSFYHYINNAIFTDRLNIPNSELFSVNSLIGMLNELHIEYNVIKDELILLKSNTTVEAKDIYDAMLDHMINKLNKFEFSSNYNIQKIRDWFDDFDISEEQFFSWHDIIEEDNDLYIILDTHISWLDPNMEPNHIEYPFLEKYNFYDLEAIHGFFTDYIKDSFIKKLMIFLEEQKFSTNNDSISKIYVFRKKESFVSFETYINEYIIDPYPDYSYLFQRLKHEKLIEHVPHKEFMEWLKDKDYISDKTYQELYENNNFRSLKKASTANRENNFNNTFNL